MTKLKFSGIGITAMNGAIGSRVITRNSYGYYAKNKAPGPVVVSPDLRSWRSLFSFVHAAYEALTDLERAEWVAAAQSQNWHRIDDLATRQNFSGFHLFMHLNLILARTFNPLLSSPPVPVPTPQVEDILFQTCSPVSLLIRCNLKAEVTLLFYQSAQMNAGRMSLNQIYTFVHAAPFQNGANSNDIEAYSQVRFGIPVIGKKIFVQVKALNPATGICSMPQRVSAIVS